MNSSHFKLSMALSSFYQIVLIFTSLVGHITADTEYDYGMVIDAGSTHSALYVYRFELRQTSTNIPPQSSPVQIAASESTGPIGELQSQSACDTLVAVKYNFIQFALQIIPIYPCPFCPCLQGTNKNPSKPDIIPLIHRH